MMRCLLWWKPPILFMANKSINHSILLINNELNQIGYWHRLTQFNRQSTDVKRVSSQVNRMEQVLLPCVGTFDSSSSHFALAYCHRFQQLKAIKDSWLTCKCCCRQLKDLLSILLVNFVTLLHLTHTNM